MQKVSIVVPNWNGAKDLPDCLDSLLEQTLTPQIVVVDNGSADNSLELLENKYPEVEVVALKKNHGFAGGVNVGIKKAIGSEADYIALLNNDATVDKKWIAALAEVLDKNSAVGIVTSKILGATQDFLDSTGESYTTWGLPYPRGRNEIETAKYDKDTLVFGASGGASLYRVKMLEEIGLFDDKFFAYYEDVDLSFRAQLYGWKVAYEPKAEVYHQISATTGKIPGFATYQTMKNLPLLFWKNVPRGLLLKILVRFKLAYFSFYLSALTRGQGWPALKGLLRMLTLLPHAFYQRHKIQKNKKVSADYIDSILVHDLPTNAYKLKGLRSKWWKIRGKK
jgi:GT2 family glycosyltransferase